jgi:CRISPR type III-A-associated RAMP protein Csm5
MGLRLVLETLTPVHIWSGTNYGPSDYYVDGEELIRVDFYGLVGDREFQRYKEKVIWALNRRASIHGAAPSLAERHVLYRLRNKGVFENKTVREFIKTSGRPYIPGSSLKGAILTALIWDHVKTRSGLVTERDFANERVMERKNREIIGSVLREVGKGDPAGRDKPQFNRWIGVTDSELAGMEDLMAVKVGVYPSGPTIFAEVLREGVSLRVELDSLSGVDLNKVLDKVDIFYREVLNKENEWRRKNGLGELKFSKEGRLVRIGSGSSQLATSIRSLFRLREPRTRKVVEPEKISMGWAVLR